MTVLHAAAAVPLLLGSLVASPVLADFADAFASPEEAAQVNERTVGVVLERNEHFFDLMEDIESSLSLVAGLRIVPIVGRNHVQNVYDLLYLDGVDLALVRSDSIEYVRRVAGLAGARRLTRNVAKVGEEKIVVIAREVYTSLDELAGQPIAFGRPGSGEFVTGTLMFDSIGVDVGKVEAEGERALEKVRSGELAAMVHLLGSPGALAEAADAASEGVGVIALPPDDRLSKLYRPATLDAKDLPGLIGTDETVSTYSVDVNLVAYSWNSRNDRTRRMGPFVKALVDRLEELQGDASQPEWEGVRLETRTPNIDSSPMVERALAEREAALERWHARRALARESEAEVRAVLTEEPAPGRATVTTTGRSGDRPRRRHASGLERLFDELDALLAPAGIAPPGDADTSGERTTERRAPAIPEPHPGTAGG